MAEREYLPIHTAAHDGDVDALRRELESGVSPDVVSPQGLVPLHYVVAWADHDRVACVRLLAAAGANMSSATPDGKMTALLYAARDCNPTVMAALLDAGSDVNQRDADNWTPLHYAIYSDRGAESIRILINAGAALNARCRDGMTPLELCISRRQRFLRSISAGDAVNSERQRRLYPILLRAGAALPAETDDAYIRKVRAAGSFQNYERAHLNAITATFLQKLPSLPPEMVRLVVEYAFHTGDY